MKGIKGRHLVIAATVLMLFTCSLAMNLYTMSNSALFLCLLTSCLFFASTNLFLIALKRTGNKKNKKTAKNIKKLSDFFGKKKQKAKGSERSAVPAKKKRRINVAVLKKALLFAIYAFILLFCSDNIVVVLSRMETQVWATLSFAVILIIVFAVFVVLDKLCKHSQGDTPFVSVMLKNCRLFIKLISFQFIVSIACIILSASNIIDTHKYVSYALGICFFYYLFFTVISLIVVIIKNKIAEEPYINIPIPFSSDNRSFSFIDFLENSTVITMRSLWSVKYIKKIAPAAIVSVLVIFWLSTGVIQVESYQEAAVYRFGALREKTLKPGLHIVLPYPFDKTEIYDTDTVKKMTIGYNASEPSDNIWTSSHGSEEYKLLLGNGDELVSINLRLEYKINDLKKYLKSASSPEMILEALAYELVTDKTIKTDLSTLLSTDRDAFADNFKNELIQKLAEFDSGLEVVCVILESIHPPVEISSVYQQIISAEITAEKYILDARAEANVKIANAEADYDTAVNNANAENSEKVAAAKTSVAEFTASLNAYRNYGDKYKYQKYLNAVREAYGKANLVILSDDVDGSAIYFGRFSDGNTTVDPKQEAVVPNTEAAEPEANAADPNTVTEEVG